MGVCVFSFLPNSLRAWQGQGKAADYFSCSSEWIVHNKKMLMLSVFMKALEFINFAKEVKLNQDLIGICIHATNHRRSQQAEGKEGKNLLKSCFSLIK